MKHLAGEPRQSTCSTTDECRGCPDSRPQKVKVDVRLLICTNLCQTLFEGLLLLYDALLYLCFGVHPCNFSVFQYLVHVNVNSGQVRVLTV
jgi:hypothetical protein